MNSKPAMMQIIPVKEITGIILCEKQKPGAF
jgi:hypothetical protein